MGSADDRRWKVGELAKATGLTVRALHHYDELALLVPSERTSAGHRLYLEQDVIRLYRILALRRLGLRLEQIASLLDDDGSSLLDTVRRHLAQMERELEHQHRLRERLRQMLAALERSIEPPAEEFIDAMEAMSVIEAKLEDVIVCLPDAEAEAAPAAVAHSGCYVVLLKERGGERELPIWIGQPEAVFLTFALCGEAPPRPLGPDLTLALLEVGGVRVERVVIESLRENTLYASVSVGAGGESHEVDARPSDALNLAARLGAPVFVAAELIEQAGVVSYAERLRAEGQGDWRSVAEVVEGELGAFYGSVSVQSVLTSGDFRRLRQARE